MGRPSKQDQLFLRAAEAELAAVQLDAPVGWQDWLEAFRTHSGAALTSVHRVALHGSTLGIDFEITADAGRGFGVGLHRMVAETQPGGSILYDPSRPEPKQRNVVLTPYRDVLGRDPAIPEAMFGFARACRFDVAGQVRALVCDGPILLAWVGGAWPVDETGHAAHLLRSLLPAIRSRLMIDRAFGHAPLLAATLQASLEALGVPAYLVVNRFGRDRIELTNTAGARALDREGAAVLSRIDESRARAPDGGMFRIVAVDSPGVPRATLAIARSPIGLGSRLMGAAERFGLTPRQLEVLELVLLGHTNRTIGELLRCAEGTAEQHVSALLEKMGADTRSQLVAQVWSCPEV
jgi:DNA-binding CsgD family transcriptional regulator